MVKNNCTKTKTLSKPVFTLKTSNRSFQVTREGAGFILLIFAVGIGAIYSGSNLLYLILAMCLSFVIVSGVLSELVLQKISIKSSLPPTIYAGDAFSISLGISNGKKYFSSYSLSITMKLNGPARLEENPAIYLFHMPPGAAVEKTLIVKAVKRGLLRINEIQISTGFPFGLFYKTRNIQTHDETIVFPKIQPVNLPSLSFPSAEEGQGAVHIQGKEIVALREYSEGDPLNAVHWKSSAKTGHLRVKEFMTAGDQSFTLFLNLNDPQTNRQVPDAILEERIGEAASLAYNLIRRGNEVSLKTEDRVQFPFGNTETHLERIMKFLALIGLRKQEN